MIRSVSIVGIAIVTLIGSASAQGDYQTQEINSIGVRMKVHKKLKQVPMKLGVKTLYLRAGFEPDNVGDYITGRHGVYSWGLRFYEFTDRREGSGAAEVTGQADAGEKKETKAGRRKAKKPEWHNNFRDWVTDTASAGGERKFIKKDVKTKAKGKKPGYSWWEYSDTSKRHDGVKPFDLVFYMTTIVLDSGPGKQIAAEVRIPIVSGRKLKSQHKKWAVTMLRSIELMETSDEDLADARKDEWAKTPMQKAALAKARANIQDLESWDYFTTEHYIILYSWRPNKKRDSYRFALKLSKGMEGIREKYLEYFPPHEQIADIYPVLRICAKYDDFSRYGNSSPGVVGWFSPSTKELVVFDDAFNQMGGEEVVTAIAFHEGWHQYADSYFNSVELHRWFGEGVGDFFGGFEPSGRNWRYTPVKWRIDNVTKQRREESHVPFKDIVTWNKDKFYGNARTVDFYSQSYTFIDFLVRGKKKGGYGSKWDPEWDMIMERYIQTMLKTKDQKKAVEAAFGNVDWDALEAAWQVWVDKHIKKKGI